MAHITSHSVYVAYKKCIYSRTRQTKPPFLASGRLLKKTRICDAATYCNTHWDTRIHTASHCKRRFLSWRLGCTTIESTAKHCDTLRHTVTYCISLQHAATQCKRRLLSRRLRCLIRGGGGCIHATHAHKTQTNMCCIVWDRIYVCVCFYWCWCSLAESKRCLRTLSLCWCVICLCIATNHDGPRCIYMYQFYTVVFVINVSSSVGLRTVGSGWLFGVKSRSFFSCARWFFPGWPELSSSCNQVCLSFWRVPHTFLCTSWLHASFLVAFGNQARLARKKPHQ